MLNSVEFASNKILVNQNPNSATSLSKQDIHIHTVSALNFKLGKNVLPLKCFCGNEL